MHFEGKLPLRMAFFVNFALLSNVFAFLLSLILKYFAWDDWRHGNTANHRPFWEHQPRSSWAGRVASDDLQLDQRAQTTDGHASAGHRDAYGEANPGVGGLTEPGNAWGIGDKRRTTGVQFTEFGLSSAIKGRV